MANTRSGGRKPQIHFERVPLEVVKKVAKIDEVEETTSGTAGDIAGRRPNKAPKSVRVPTRSAARKK